ALLGEHVTGPYEGQPKPPLEVVVVTREKASGDERRHAGRGEIEEMTPLPVFCSQGTPAKQASFLCQETINK
ncbi:hypothetical protein, partial [Anaerostipes butyraticus]|uniref:hypothetical protein n=1 Tax=Anaerostipes butyraticus TaxID=645466 RepID=UPI0023A8539B